MVTTRAGAAKASRKGTPPRQLDQDSPLPSVEPVSPVSPTPSLVISTNNLSYNVSSFDANHRRRVKRGLQDSGIRMKYCTTYVDNEDPEIQTQHFFINDNVQVAMGGRLRRPQCSCGANENGVACKVSLHASEPHGLKANNSLAYLLGGRSRYLHGPRCCQGSAAATFYRWINISTCETSRRSTRERSRGCRRRSRLDLRRRRCARRRRRHQGDSHQHAFSL